MPLAHARRLARRALTRATGAATSRPPRPKAGPEARPGSPSAPPPSPADYLPIRFDALPDPQPFPDAQQIIVVGGIPRNYAGRTASILAKTRIWWEQQGVRSTIVVTNHSSELDDVSQHFREAGVLAEGVTLASLYDYLPDDSSHSGPPIEHPVTEDGLHHIVDEDQPVYRYFDHDGVYRMYKRYDRQGRLLTRDHFHSNRSRTRRDEYRLDGTLKRTAFMDYTTNRPRQDIYYRSDGTPVMNVWLGPEPIHRPPIQRVTFFDGAGRPTEVGTSRNEVLHSCLDRLVGDRPAVVSVEARGCDELMLGYRNPHVRTVYVLHNAHIAEPYRDIALIRPTYEPLFANVERADAVVFLTNTQRAEAEAHFGHNDRFRVIPHSAKTPAPVTDPVERDPDLVIMMARLDAQKQVDHAVSAFAKVVKQRPTARLEIYGRGPLKDELADQIHRLGLEGSVELVGFTKRPDLAYLRASACIMTSRHEGAPLTILEAFMYRCPVISYVLKYGPPDMLNDGVNGFLVPYGDRAGLAQRILQVLDDPGLQDRLARGAYDARRAYSEEALAARWAGLFNELTQNTDIHGGPRSTSVG